MKKKKIKGETDMKQLVGKTGMNVVAPLNKKN